MASLMSLRLTCSSALTVSPALHLLSSASSTSTLPLRRATFSFSFSYRRFHSSAVNSSLTVTTFLTVLALLPKSNVDLVSDSLKLAGEQQITIVVLAFPKKPSVIVVFQKLTGKRSPPRDSWRIRVNLESLYGIWVLLPSANALITFPSADSDLLMFLASSNTVPKK